MYQIAQLQRIELMINEYDRENIVIDVTKTVQFNLALKEVLKHQFTQVPDATRTFSKKDGLLTLYQKKVENKHSKQINDEDEMIIDSADLIQITDGLVD